MCNRADKIHLLKLAYESSFKILKCIKEHLDEYAKKFPYDNAQRVSALCQRYHKALTECH
ncbi:hypothetical protein [Helicobacter acinonychis]|uniref:hypothetical protein n=1 Tax=Helicobacter acinonychis TaxID=212 RepID=UPI001F28EFC5|nr:hypothetical protein [Helicobacter acinonychis]